ncbi:2-succinyl-6-hydroxy-2, 4-cyclohexadiene-1-carboxylate synthase, partial [Haemophilus influenzae]
GERDHKFQTITKENQINLVTIPCAGHNSHLENSKYFSKKIENCILKIARP